ncbi:AraC family transcriptional regulator [Oceanobacillus kapialis]|uniref:Helix-turn-helix domain-containing protein n=1 Tax=Oceanobacillus kapialis TaxID=481353 RepID=A0ABW5Q2V5_9BACI
MAGIKIKENVHSDKDLVKSHHHSIHQILYVLESKGKFIFNNQAHPFKKDHVAIIPPYAEHAIVAEEKMTVLVLEFDINQLDIGMQQAFHEKENFSKTCILELSLFDAVHVRQLLRRMLYEQSRMANYQFLATKIFLSELMLTLLRATRDETITNANSLRAERLRKYINENYFEITDAGDISQRLGISARHVNTIFKESYQTTPMKYLNEVRMETAKKLLMETDKDITSICFEVGFESLSTFYRRFKEYMNISPHKFRLNSHYTTTKK